MTWLPPAGTGVDEAFAAYMDATLVDTTTEFAEFAKMKRLLAGLNDPNLIANATRQMGECMKRDWHEHTRYLDHNGENGGELIAKPEEEEAEDLEAADSGDTGFGEEPDPFSQPA